VGSKQAYESSDTVESDTSTDRERRLKKKKRMTKNKLVRDSSDSDESGPCWVEEEARKEREESAMLAATGAKTEASIEEISTADVPATRQ
jgi:hypothetical protein